MSQFWERYIHSRFQQMSRNVSLKAIYNGYKSYKGPDALLWKRITFLVATPAIGLCMINAYKSLEDERDERELRQPKVKYEYMRRRNKRFPWGDGDRSLFHNSRTNGLREA